MRFWNAINNEPFSITMNIFATRNTPAWQRITLLSGLGATILMVLYAALYWDSNKPLAMLSGKPDSNRIDLFVEQVHGIKFDRDGKLTETLHATRLDHFPERNESVMVNPILDMQGSNGKMWKISAETGTLVGDNEIRLQKNVVIIDSTQTLRFESERLNYFSDTQIAKTDDAVKLQHTADITTALGMRANLNTNRIELMRNVDSRYVQTQ